MARYYQRPENALKKATEFIEVGKPTRALDTLYDVIKGKKHRAFSEKVIEPIMLKYLELCVELRKPHTAKEGLYQYRLMCQSVNVGLLEKVIRSYIKMAEERTDQARDSLKSKAQEESQKGIAEVDDLDNLSMAEMTLLNVVTEEQAQERSDRAALIPWVKFLWESYTQCLDLLRNNARLESLYHDIAQMAFKFCLSYTRKTEFRKLCERLRKHFDDVVNRASTQVNSIDVTAPETQQLNMETRLAQLDSAITMELWQEAYKAIEDIHLLMNLSKKSQTRMMAYYYQKLSLVFWKSGNLLFHAATLLKYYLLCKDMKKNVSQDELQKNASQVVVATLAIPFPVVHPEFERFVETEKGMLEKSQKLATLLFLPSPPTRSSLIRDLNRHGVLEKSLLDLQTLHDILETEFNPLELCQSVDKHIKAIQGDVENQYLEQYIEPLQDVALARLIKQISQVYQSIDYDHLITLTVFSNELHLEQLLVDMVRYSDMQITIDHRENCIRFGLQVTETSHEELDAGPKLQEMPSDLIRMQLVNVFNHLEDAIDAINPDHISLSEEKLRSKIYSNYLLTEKKDHIQLLQRQKIISDRREELERSAVDRENEEKWRTEQVLKQQQVLEQKRLEVEREERERKRVEIERKEIEKRRIKERVDQMMKTPYGKMVIGKYEEDLANLDVETVLLRQQQEMAKEAKDHIDKMKSHAKRVDHLERAKRLEEITVIEQHVVQKKQTEKLEWELHEKERITNLIEDRKVAVANRDRMKRMMEDKDNFLKKLLEARRHVFVSKLSEYEKRLVDEKAKRLSERAYERQEQRRRTYIEEKEAEERRKQEEIQREEEEKLREEREKTMKEVAERNRITLEKQMAKEREIEERLQKERTSMPSRDIREREPRDQREPTDVWRPSRDRGSDRERPTPTAAAAADTAPAAAGSAGKWVPPSLRKKKTTDGLEPEIEEPVRDSGREIVKEERPTGGFRTEERGSDRRDDRFGGERGGDRRDDRYGAERGGDRRDDRFGGGERRDDRFGERGGSDRRDDRFGDRGGERFAERGSDRRPERGGERRDFGDRGGDRRDFGDRGGERREFSDRGGDRRDFGDRGAERRDFGDRGGDRRPERGGERRDFGDRGGERRDFGDRGVERRGEKTDREVGGTDENWRRPAKKET